MSGKKDLYRWVKLGGFASFIPLVLVTGPLTGFFLGDYIEKKFYPGSRWPLMLALIGLCAAIVEVIRIIRAMIKVS